MRPCRCFTSTLLWRSAFCWFAFSSPVTRKSRAHILRLILSALVPATFFVWTVSDHFGARSVLEFHPGWVQREGEFKMPFFRFWFFNFGILVPLILTLVGMFGYRVWKEGFRWGQKQPEEIVFVFGAAAIFLFAFFIKTAPWGWDNLKIMIWSYFIVLPFVWRDLIRQWERPIRWAVCFALFASGFISLFGGLAAGKGGFGFASRGEVDAVSAAVGPMPIEARFAAWPTYNHPLLLSGRKVVMGYPGHLWTQGFDDYGKTNEMLTKLMQGGPSWRDLARTLHVRYIFWGREEKAKLCDKLPAMGENRRASSVRNVGIDLRSGTAAVDRARNDTVMSFFNASARARLTPIDPVATCLPSTTASTSNWRS